MSDFRTETINAVKSMGITAKELGFKDADGLEALCIAKSKQYNNLTNAVAKLIKELDVREDARGFIPEEFWEDLEIADKKYKVVRAKVSRMVYAEVLVAIPEDGDSCDVEDALNISWSNSDALTDYVSDEDDWEYEDYYEVTNSLTGSEVKERYDQDELWNYEDLED